MSAEWNDHPFSFRKVTLSPRRLRAKYTLRTNLRFVLWVFRPCRGLVITLILSFSALSQRKPQQRFSPLSVCLRRRNSGNRFIGCKKSMPVVPQNKIPVSCAKTANYNRIFINLSLTVCQKNGTLFFLCVSEISVIVVLVATDKKRERTTPTTARSFSHP